LVQEEPWLGCFNNNALQSFIAGSCSQPTQLFFKSRVKVSWLLLL
jgi:hypothetical protein